MTRAMEIATPLGEDLLFHRMRAREQMSTPFEYHVDLLSVKRDINLDDMLGKNVTVKLALADDSTRFFNGYVTRFAQGGSLGRYTRYFAVVHPWLWFLTRTSDCRIFQDMTVPDIIKTVFGDEPTNDFKLELTSSYRKWTYCVQYRETDFNFVSRMMEEEGIYYYVRHTDGHHTVVLTDSTGKHVPTPGYETIPLVAPGQIVRPELEHISSWDFGREIQPAVYAHTDYDLERPAVKLHTQKAASRQVAPRPFEVFDYPGNYLQKADGEQYASVRIDELGSQFETAKAVTNAKGIAVGSLFTLAGSPRDDQNREHVILAASYDLEFSGYEAMPEGSGTSYECSFTAMSSQQQFRPRRVTPKPFVQGPQTAVVVGPAAEDIYTDELGRVKVQFHWDRYGRQDENSSCWIRVSHYWAGKGWGAVHTPRIGHEVIVDFLEGDPDQPIIVGRVYNAVNVPPYKLPEHKTQSGVKSRSSLAGTPENFNEIRFEDLKGQEQVYVHAEKNLSTTVEASESRSVGGDRSTTIGHDDVLTVKNDHKVTVSEGSASLYVDGHNRVVIVNEQYYLLAKSIYEEAAEESVQIKATAADVSVNAATQINQRIGESANYVLIKSDGSVTVSAASKIEAGVAGNIIKIGDDGKISVTAGAEIKLGVGANTITINSAGVAINGAAITIAAVGENKISGALVKINS